MPRSRASGIRSSTFPRAQFGNQTSPNASTRSITPGPLPPTSTGGCGRWAGFGHDQIRSNSTKRQLGAARVGRVPGRGDVRVLREVERVVPVLLDQAGDLARPGGVVGGEVA